MTATATPNTNKTKKTKAAKAANKTPGKVGAPRGPRGFRWTEKRVAIVKAMKALRAFDGTTSKPAAKIAEKSGLTEQDVKHYCYKENDLVKEGFVKIADVEGQPVYGYYLSAKGQSAEAKVEKPKAE